MDFEIQADHRISARRPEQVIIYKKKKKKKRKKENENLMDLAVPAKKDKYVDLARELRKL